jgi:hypothetical protein
MAASTTTDFPLSAPAPAVTVGRLQPKRHRHINPRAGRALEILGHAIEYLADEFELIAESFTADNPQLEAVQLLMALNRQIYFECPEVPSLGERCIAFLHLPVRKA